MAPQWSDEESLNKFLDEIKDEALDARDDLNKRIEESLNQFRGKQWTSRTNPTYLNNIISQAIEDKVGKLSETRPEISVLASVNGTQKVAEVLSQCVSHVWDVNQISYRIERLGIWCALAGVGFAGTPFNKYRAGGLGDIDFVVKDPRNCGIDVCITDPADTDLGEYTYAEDYIPLDIIRAEYPGRGMLVKPDIRLSGVDATKMSSDARGLVRGAFRRLFGNKDKEKTSAIPRGIVEEFFIKDRRASIDDAGVAPIVENITSWAEDGGIPFPGGRRIIRAGNIILEDCYNPFWDGGSDLDMMGWKIDPETAWSADEVKSVRRMQESHNRIGDAYTKSALINSVVRIIMDSGAVSPKEKNKLTNQVGQIIEKAPGRNFEYNVPPPLPADTINFAWALAERIREKIGVADPPTTKDVPSIITGPAIEGLQLMLQTSIRTAARRTEAFYQRVGQKLISRIFQFYTSDRILHLVGPDQKWMQFEFKRLNILKDAQGKPRSKEDMQKAYRDFYFIVQPGSSLAITKQARMQGKFLLVQLGLLHPKEILMELYANPEEKIQDAQEARDQGMFSQMQQNQKPQSPQSSGQMAA